ncbi:MAG: glycoside hydrolase family 2 protein, partial [Lachnospiraceae bacterium]|nr:glycoside hydrolase family 2 protein [Lachnospiraceae bacterium]
MIRQQLHENWQMRDTAEDVWIPASVPGSVYNDYLQNGKMDDPYYRDNETAALALMDRDYEYSTVFSPKPEVYAAERIVLEFLGIDTVADVFLNGRLLSHVENMHRTWRFEVKGLLRPDENLLTVLFRSPTRFIKAAYEKTPENGSEEAMKGFPLLRKAHCMFGWDWGPHLPDAGIWRAVSLVGSDPVVIDSLYITQKHEGGKVRLLFDPALDDLGLVHPFLGSDSALSYDITITDP